jgi:hypothetical protein
MKRTVVLPFVVTCIAFFYGVLVAREYEEKERLLAQKKAFEIYHRVTMANKEKKIRALERNKEHTADYVQTVFEQFKESQPEPRCR